jgi:hypothetical protein
MANEKRPSILGRAMNMRAGGWVWKRGPIEVEILPSATGPRPDFSVTVEIVLDHRDRNVGDGIAGRTWRPTEEEAAKWAERQLLKIARAVEQKPTKAQKAIAGDRYE